MIFINVIISISSLYTLNNVQNSAIKIDDVLTKAFQRVNTLKTQLEVLDHTFTSNLGDADKDTSELLREGVNQLEMLKKNSNTINPEYLGTDSYRRRAIALSEKLRETIDSVETKVFPLVRAGDERKALQVYVNTASNSLAQANTLISEIFSEQTRYCIALSSDSVDRTPMIINICLTIFGAALGIGFAFAIAGYMSNALNNQMTLLRNLEKGDFSFHIGEGHADEFGQSQEVIRSMRGSLSDIIALTQSESNKLQDEMRSLQEISHKISNVSNDIQNQAITVAAAADQMVSTTTDIARNCESAALGSDKCKSITTEGLSKVGDAVANIRQQSEHTKDNAAKIENLARQSKEIGSIVSTIDDIAAQTNLLALNAAIEAARAGEAGRGFAVVADEVRALASRTSSSTQEISRMVKNIQEEATVATDSITASVANMETVAEDSQHIMEILNEITEQVNSVNSQIAQIATAAEEQTAATGEISSHMQNITQVTSEMANDANDQYTAMDSAYNDLTKLKKAISFFKLHKA